MGLQEDRRQAHPAEYNLSLEAEATSGNRRKLWSHLEVGQIAALEAAYDGPKLGVNKYLATKLDRTLESVKGKRRCTEYKELVSKLLSEREREDDFIEEFTTPPSSPETSDVFHDSLTMDESRPPMPR